MSSDRSYWMLAKRLAGGAAVVLICVTIIIVGSIWSAGLVALGGQVSPNIPLFAMAKPTDLEIDSEEARAAYSSMRNWEAYLGSSDVDESYRCQLPSNSRLAAEAEGGSEVTVQLVGKKKERTQFRILRKTATGSNWGEVAFFNSAQFCLARDRVFIKGEVLRPCQLALNRMRPELVEFKQGAISSSAACQKVSTVH
jgi:hypothetical protein